MGQKSNKRKKDKHQRKLAEARRENYLKQQPHRMVAELPDVDLDPSISPNEQVFKDSLKIEASSDAKYDALFDKDSLPDSELKGYYRSVLKRMPPGSKVVRGDDNKIFFVSPKS